MGASSPGITALRSLLRGPLAAGDIAKAAGWQPRAVGAKLRALEREGFVRLEELDERQRNGRPATVWHITRKGYELVGHNQQAALALAGAAPATTTGEPGPANRHIAPEQSRRPARHIPDDYEPVDAIVVSQPVQPPPPPDLEPVLDADVVDEPQPAGASEHTAIPVLLPAAAWQTIFAAARSELAHDQETLDALRLGERQAGLQYQAGRYFNLNGQPLPNTRA